MKAIVTVTGKDRKGIIADVCRILADNGINILHEVEDRMTLEDYYFDLIGGAAD